ncbi:MAG: hypothetical protein COY81_00335 [Candidatus Pacebacteria bacterium CG_4_10_14_0_8_um_filter_43_12]|nr:MAG: hypothetical protein COY81_00335 [Candidatus Pacebacteria bacterium CG_4_10_14_0_8_um_filter_43_12]
MPVIRFPFLISLFFFSLFFFMFFASGMIDSQDGFQYMAIARRLYYDHTFEMPQEQFPNDNIHMSTTDSNGKLYSPTGLGYTLALIPAVIGEDLFLRLANEAPISGFPLSADWPVLLFASMTNAIFGALLVVILYWYLRSYQFTHQTALVLSFLGIVATNLFVYTKHVYPHMMFACFLTAAFFGVRMLVITNKRYWILFAGAAYGVVVLAYNQTYLLPAPFLALYYFLLRYSVIDNIPASWIAFQKRYKSLRLNNVLKLARKLMADLLTGIVGFIPFWLLYSWFNVVRFGNGLTAGYGEGIPIPKIPFSYVIFEGIWGLLFSPGRSIFVYSPALLLLILFWWKLKKKLMPEIICFSLLALVYIIFFGTLTGSPTFMVWHGEMSWGNRYFVSILPLLWILIAQIVVKLSNIQRWLVFAPLVILGIYIEILGLLLPYQIKTAGLPLNIYVGEDRSVSFLNYNYGEYPNFLPRFSAVFKMSKTLVKRLKSLPQTYDHGQYNLRLYDGFEAPFEIGWTVWRGVRPIAQLSFDSNKQASANKLILLLRNHVMDPASSHSAQLSYLINNQVLSTQSVLAPNEEARVELALPSTIKEKDNHLQLNLSFEATSAAWIKDRQVIFLQGLIINGEPQNLATQDYPYISPISKSILNLRYVYWGGNQTELWDIWQLHSQVFEQTFDFWWLRPLHYWDLPKLFFESFFLVNISGIAYFGWLVWWHSQGQK